jgi:hypothetical protein
MITSRRKACGTCTDMRNKRDTYIFLSKLGAKSHFRYLAGEGRIKVTKASQNKV